MPTAAPLEAARHLICALQNHIRDTVLAARRRGTQNFAKVAGVTAADTIYQIDRVSEAAVLGWFEQHWPKAWPVEIIMEGHEEGAATTFPRGTSPTKTQWKCILDPIDGTRGLMYDKRSAWILTGLAPQRGARTTSGDIVVAAMTELPTTKQWRADQISAIAWRGPRGVAARAYDVRARRWRRIVLRRSEAIGFEHGFASLVKFFPDGKALTAQIEEALWRELIAKSGGGSPLIFDEQYISTGGQIYELLAGHDRMIGDLRPLVFAKRGIVSSLTCHPYDICTELILREAGGIVETPVGRPVRVPLDTTTPVAWMGYANPALARRVRPVLRRLVKTLL